MIRKDPQFSGGIFDSHRPLHFFFSLLRRRPVPELLAPVRPLSLREMQDARRRIAGSIVRTPLVRIDLGPGFPDIRLKLENLQATNSYKLRGAVNAVALLSDAERRRGVWTISAGLESRADAGARREAGACAPTSLRGRRSVIARSRASKAPLSIRSMTTISSPATARWDSRSSRTPRIRPPS